MRAAATCSKVSMDLEIEPVGRGVHYVLAYNYCKGADALSFFFVAASACSGSLKTCGERDQAQDHSVLFLSARKTPPPSARLKLGGKT